MRKSLLSLLALVAIASAGLVYSRDDDTPPVVIGLGNGDHLGCEALAYVRSEDRNSIEITDMTGQPIDGVAVHQQWHDDPVPGRRGGDEFKIFFPCGYSGPVWIKFTDSWTKKWTEIMIWVDCQCGAARTVTHSEEPPLVIE